MKNQKILESRRQRTADILREKGLRAALICNPRRDSMERWLLDEDPLPGLPPFGTLNILLVADDATVEAFSADVNHPCDFPHYRLFCADELSSRIHNRRIGIVNSDFLLRSTYESLMERYPGLEFIDISSEIHQAKARKTEEEVAAMRRSAMLYDRVMQAMPLVLRQGITEMEAVIELRHRLALIGAGVEFLSEDPSLSSLVTLTSAPDGCESAAEPMVYPGRRIVYGDRVNVTVRGTMPEGCAAMGRTFVLGNPSEKSKHLWSLALKAQDTAAALLRPGVTLREVCRDVNTHVLSAEGCLQDNSCWIHGIGCSPCESPRCVDSSADTPLEVNMTLVIAPRVCLPGIDPYCCMDTFVVTEDGCKQLYPADRNLRII